VTAVVTSAAVVLAAITLVVLAFATRGLRWLGAVILSIWVVWTPVWFVVLFLSVYGDPGPTTCRA
jgi:hypothetical protein